jgi:hypothetical protein
VTYTTEDIQSWAASASEEELRRGQLIIEDALLFRTFAVEEKRKKPGPKLGSKRRVRPDPTAEIPQALREAGQ